MDDMNIVPRIGGPHAGYLFEFRQDGVFFTVYPAGMMDMMFELSDMRQILKEYSVDDYDIEKLARTVREAAGVPVKLADSFILPPDWKPPTDEENGEVPVTGPLNKNYGSLTVEVSRDRMEVKVRFSIAEGQAIPTEEMVSEALQLKNVTFGIDLEAIQEGCKDGRPFVAARGIPSIPGEDAKLIKKFDMSAKGRPVANEYDQVDYKNLNLCIIARKGQILAERIPHTKGIPGTNIYGDKVPVKNGKPRPMPMGKNTEVQDDNFLVASIDGQIVENGNKISVDPHLVIRGDVGVGTGNIDFIGGVEIGGDVELGFKVKATGDVEIKGNVHGADVTARNIYVTGGIQGMSRGHIRAEEDVRANFAENADIEAGGNVYVNDVILHSTVRAGRVLQVEGGKGQITGGMMAAGEEISAAVIGNTANVVTRLSVGVNPLLQKQYQAALKEYMEAKKRLDQLNKTLNTLGKIDLNLLPKDKVDKINSLVRSQFPLAGKVERGEKQLKELDAELQKMKKGKIRVKDVMYPGARLSINAIIKNVQVEEKHCVQYVEDEFIRTGPYN